MARLKLCSHRGCTRILDMDSKFCEYHQEKYMKLQKERYKDYQRRRLEDYNEVRSQAFYQSLDWDRLKEAVKASFFHIDIFLSLTIFKSINNYINRAVDEPATTARFGRNERSI